MSNTVRVSVSSFTIIKTLFWIGLVIGLYFLRDVVTILLVSVVLASAMEPYIKMLMRWKFSRGFAVLSLFAAIILSAGAIGFFFLPTLADDVARFIKTLPDLLESVRLFGKDLGLKGVAKNAAELSKDVSAGQILEAIKNTVFAGGSFLEKTSVFISGVIHVVLTFVIAFYLAAEDDGVKKFLRLIVPKQKESYIEGLWDRAQHKITKWMQGQLLLSLILSVLVFVPLFFLDVPYAFLLAVFAFFGELVPVVGLTIAMFPALLLGWFHGGVSLLGSVFLVYFIAGQLESHVIYPKIMNKVVGVPSVLIIIAVVVGAKLAGFWGVLLAVPMASIFMELVSDIEKGKIGNNE